MLVARRATPMNLLKEELLKLNPQLEVHIHPCDLSNRNDREVFWNTLQSENYNANILINNAGLGDYGEFQKADTEKLYQQIEVNITALTLMTHEFVKQCKTLNVRYSGILNVSSLASALPVPDLSVYAATKAYVTSFTEGIAIELASQGVTLTALCPGPTPTNFGSTAQRKNDVDIDRSGQEFLVIPPEQVVREGLAALEKHKTVHFAGGKVRFAATLFRLLPRPLLRLILRLRYQRAH